MVKTNISDQQKIKKHILESAEVKKLSADQCIDQILKATDLITKSFRAGNKILLCGNGGSAADCQHMAAEFVNLLTKEFNRPPLPAIALTTDTSFLTSHANDFHFDSVFARQLQGLGQAGDVLISISTSGNSKNVCKAVETAKSMRIKTVALTGNSGKLGKIADVAIMVPSINTQYIQESHLSIEHVICELVEYNLFKNKGIK